jgi:hypothetical protein
MNYIYDILLNFDDKEIYEFYEWDGDDPIDYVKRIPIIKVCDKAFNHIRNYDVIIDKEFLNKIYKCSEIYNNKVLKIINYACLFTNTKDVIAIEFHNDGRSLMKSCLLIDEANEVTEIAESLREVDIKYKILNYNNNHKYLTRNEKRINFFLNKELNNIYRDKNIDKLKYYYYECFGKVNNNINDIYEELKKFINSDWNGKHKYLYDLVVLSYKKEVMGK